MIKSFFYSLITALFFVVSSQLFADEVFPKLFLHIESRIQNQKEYKKYTLENDYSLENNFKGKNIVLKLTDTKKCYLTSRTKYSKNEALIVCTGPQKDTQIGLNCEINNSRDKAIFFYDEGINSYIRCNQKTD